MLIAIVVLSLAGFIDTFQTTIAKADTFVAGYGLGYTHPNRLAGTITYIIFCFVCYKNNTLKKKDMAFICTLAGSFYFITRSRTLLYCTVLFCYIYWLYKRRNNKRIIKVINAVSMWSTPVCVFLSISIPLALLTATGTLQKIIYAINLAFSRRFTHIEHAFLANPVSLFGGMYDFENMSDMFGYAVVDNGYIRFMYNYGIIGLIFSVALSVFCIYKLVQKKEYIYLIVCVIAAIQGLLENTYMYIGLNILVIFWAEVIMQKSSVKSRSYVMRRQ